MRRTVRQMMVRVAVVAVWLAIVVWLAKAVQRTRVAATEAQCHGHLAQIALALHIYHDAYGTFPPAYLADAEGRPMHSWRVLILPFLDQQQLYARYDFSEPWDGPNNRTLAPLMPRGYACPTHRDEGNVWTSYLAITGPGTAFPGAGSTALGAITDGTDRTILLAEVANADVPWMAPIDLDVRTMPLEINGPGGPGISSVDPGGPMVVLADASRRRLSATTLPRALRAWSTIAGGEAVGPPAP